MAFLALHLQDSENFATRMDQLKLRKNKKDENTRGGRGRGRGGGRADDGGCQKASSAAGRGRGRGRGGRGRGNPAPVDWESNWEGPWDEDEWRAWNWSVPQAEACEEDAELEEEPDNAKKNKATKDKTKVAKCKAKAKAKAKTKGKAGKNAATKAKRKSTSAGNEADDGGEDAVPVSKTSRTEDATGNKGPKTFARRYRPQREVPGVRWDAMKAAFQSIIQPKIPTAPGTYEDWIGWRDAVSGAN